MPARLLPIVLLMLMLAAGCAPPVALPAPTDMTPPPAVSTPSPAPTEAIVGQPAAPADALQVAGAAAVQVVASALGLSPAEITVTAIEEMEWSDASLGCPQPGYAYAQVITPGYRATVQAGGQTYAVHMDDQGYGLVCPPP
ncbi:MAG: hypothetical protein K1X65_17365 [Caldilineales bacterium]|nr:hypothetical protein [Caldilineales bacterium]MCW5858728.1 hypothetical protein [Caldilineales bacterium]